MAVIARMVVVVVLVAVLTVSMKLKQKGSGMADTKGGIFPLKFLNDVYKNVRNTLQGDTALEVILEDRLGINASNLDEFADLTRKIESEGGTENPKSSASGRFQFTDDSFDTALNRIERMYLTDGRDVPDWVNEAREHKDPNELTYQQEKDLFLANLYDRDASGDTDRLFKLIAEGDKEAMLEMYYKYHHTNPDEATKKRATNIYLK
jgi:hypothetical protein